ncbi:MAG: D-alanyl-D-alanine carboxypeptidase [Gammaproteobacteria bacterium]|nr:D-alanyl-D-alanine carboxypeptidase [Gammaproteobacteria bacterium]
MSVCFNPSRRSLISLLIAITMLCALGAAQAGAQPLMPTPPAIAGKGYLLVDANSGYTIAGLNADQRMEPASLTKLMTAYIVFSELRTGTIKIQDPVRISEYAWRMGGSKMFVEVGTTVTVENLLKGMIIQSGNDATVALAEHVAGSEESFAALMNNYAATLGMKGTHFVNSEGMPDPDHYTTAQDLAILTRALIREFPDYYKFYSQREFTYSNITQPNRNLLLGRDPTVDGVKTGHTETAGFNLIASAVRNNMRLISIVMGTKSEEARAQESQKLLTYGFRFFETHPVHKAGKVLTTARIYKGALKELPLGLQQDLYITFPRGRYKTYTVQMTVNKEIIAPIAKGQALGIIEVKIEGNTITKQPLVALAAVAPGGIIKRMFDEIALMLN